MWKRGYRQLLISSLILEQLPSCIRKERNGRYSAARSFAHPQSIARPVALARAFSKREVKTEEALQLFLSFSLSPFLNSSSPAFSTESRREEERGRERLSRGKGSSFKTGWSYRGRFAFVFVFFLSFVRVAPTPFQAGVWPEGKKGRSTSSCRLKKPRFSFRLFCSAFIFHGRLRRHRYRLRRHHYPGDRCRRCPRHR